MEQCRINGKMVDIKVIHVHNGEQIELPKVVGNKYTIRRKKNTYSYLPLYSGYDTETTNICKKNGKRELRYAFTYHFQVALASREICYVYLMRTWDEFTGLIEMIASKYKTSEKQRVVLWVANLGFEFQFMRKRFKWDENEFAFFAKEERKPLLCTYKGIEFRECLSISGGGLAQLCKDYTYTKKKKDENGNTDLDFKKIRSSETPLDDTEEGYCINDVVPLAEWSAYMLESYAAKGKQLPLTKTAIIRGEVKDAYKEMDPDGHFLKLLRLAYPDSGLYKDWCDYLFRGGYVHANRNHTGRTLYDVDMYDITSSYPARMNLSDFPGRFFKTEPTEENLWSAIKAGKACAFVAVFKNIRSTTPHSIESRSKAKWLEDARIDNGRIMSAKKLMVWLTELDFDNYQKFYTWDEMEIKELLVADKMKLPPYLLKVLNEHYVKKAELKAAGLNDTPEYAIEKSGVNSMFGLTVQKMEMNSIVYTDDWHTVKDAQNFDEMMEKEILLPQWGIWIAAAARHELLSVVYDIEQAVQSPLGAVIYNDTDSIKCIHDDRITAVIDAYNADIAKQLKARGLTRPAFHDLGMFDYEGKALRFKTLGAKRYMTECFNKKKNKNVIAATIAGLPKIAIDDIEGDPFEAFTGTSKISGHSVLCMGIDADKSHKTTHAYVDGPVVDIVDGVEMTELSCVAIYDIPFSLKLDIDYYNLCFHDILKKEGLL